MSLAAYNQARLLKINRPIDMPSRAVLFDQRVKVTADFGTHPWNTVLFNPQGRLLLLAGFGNLAGKVDVFDRRTLNKVTEISAPNTSWCEWSGDGKTLLTATLSPRLRVDNGIKIWHCTGRLLHVHAVDELYQVFQSTIHWLYSLFSSMSISVTGIMETFYPGKVSAIPCEYTNRTRSFY